MGTLLTANWIAFYPSHRPRRPPDRRGLPAPTLNRRGFLGDSLLLGHPQYVGLSTLTASGLNSETTYYATRAGARNWNSAANFTGLGFAVTKDTTPPAP